MALKNTWVDKIDGEDEIVADTTNEIAHAVIELEESMEAANLQYELIEEITLEEEVSSFSRNIDTNGEAYNLSGIRVRVRAPVTDSASGSTPQIIFNVRGKNNALLLYHQANNALSSSSGRATILVARNDHGLLDYSVAVSPVNGTGNKETRENNVLNPWINVASVSLTTYPNTILIPAGTTITIYGIKEATNAT